MQDIVSIKLNEENLKKVIDEYRDYQIENHGDYIIFFAKFHQVTITVYQSKKGYKATFVGENAIKEANKFDINASIVKPKEKEKILWLSENDQIGSDEVGVGDLFLPMIVVSSLVKKEDIPYLKEIGIIDSKKVSDDFILDIAPTLIHKFKFSKLTLPNQKYNEMISMGENLNSLKAKMHNAALNNLSKNNPDIKEIYIDQFFNKETYYSYLKNDKEVLRNVTFKTKGESHYISIALASIVARYSLLLEKRKLEEKYQMSFPFGSGVAADKFIQEFIHKYSKEELKKIAKANFANLKEYL